MRDQGKPTYNYEQIIQLKRPSSYTIFRLKIHFDQKDIFCQNVVAFQKTFLKTCINDESL